MHCLTHGAVEQIAKKCGDDVLICAARGIVETGFKSEGGFSFTQERGDFLRALIQLFLIAPRSLSFTSSICSILCPGITPEAQKTTPAFTVETLRDFTQKIQLPIDTKVAVCVALAQHPLNDVALAATNFLCWQFARITASAKASGKKKGAKLPAEAQSVEMKDSNIFHTTVFVMKRDSQLMPFVPLIKYVPEKNATNRTLLTLSVVAPNSFPNTGQAVADALNVLSSVDPAAAMLDAGYGCTSSATGFKNFLLQIIGTRTLSEKDVAGMLSVLTRFVHSLIIFCCCRSLFLFALYQNRSFKYGFFQCSFFEHMWM